MDLSIECKSLMADRKIFMFDSTENNLSDRLYEFNQAEAVWEVKPPLFMPRKKISAVHA
jgi:hypothetical protein